MRRIITLVLLLLALSLVGTACQDDGTEITAPVLSPAGDLVQPEKGIAYETGHCDVTLHRVLEDFWDNADDVEMRQVIMGAVVAGEETTIIERPGAWPEGYEIKIHVPATALDAYDPGTVLFLGVAVPVAAPAGEWTSIPYEFFPDGIEFSPPGVQITVCWPPYAGTPSTTGYRLLYLEQEIHEETEHYHFWHEYDAWPSGVDKLAPPPAPGEDMTMYAVGVTAWVDHFSRWDMVNGDQPPGAMPPLATGAEGREGCCWIPDEPDPDPDPDPLVPAEMLR